LPATSSTRILNLCCLSEMLSSHDVASNICQALTSGGHDGARHGEAVQVDHIKPTLKPPGPKRFKLQCDILLSTSAFKFNMRRYVMVPGGAEVLVAVAGNVLVPPGTKVGRCRLTLSNPR